MGANTRFLKQLALGCRQRILTGIDDTSRQFHHHPPGAVPILRNNANPTGIVDANTMGPVRIA